MDCLLSWYCALALGLPPLMTRMRARSKIFLLFVCLQAKPSYSLLSRVHAYIHTYTAGHLSFHPMAQCVVHALKGLACRAPVLLSHDEVTTT